MNQKIHRRKRQRKNNMAINAKIVVIKKEQGDDLVLSDVDNHLLIIRSSNKQIDEQEVDQYIKIEDGELIRKINTKSSYLVDMFDIDLQDNK